MQKEAAQAGEHIATIETSHGTMVCRLFSTLVPGAVKNFVELAKAGKYEGVPFHRIIEDFMIQGGDFENGNGTGGYSFEGEGTNICDEFHDELSHIKGALSYAKTQAPCSIGSQFFIVHPKAGTGFLDHPKGGGKAEGYTVFGQLQEDCFDVLDAIATVPTGRNDAPAEPVQILSIKIEEV